MLELMGSGEVMSSIQSRIMQPSLDKTSSRQIEMLAAGYMIVMPALTAFAITEWLRLPVLYAILAGAIWLIILHRDVFIERSDNYLYIAVFCGMLASILHPSLLSQRSITHLIALLVAVFGYYVIPRSVFATMSSAQVLAKGAAIGQAIISIYIIAEFFLNNWYGLDLSEIIPSAVAAYPQSTCAGLIRSTGWAQEPGHMAMFFEFSLPISLIYLRTCRRVVAITCVAIAALAFLMLISSGGAIAIVVGLLIVTLRIESPAKLISRLLIVPVFAIPVLIAAPFVPQLEFLFDRVGTFAGAFSSPNDTSESDASPIQRANAYSEVIHILAYSPMGIGWGTAPNLAKEGHLLAGRELQEQGLLGLQNEFAAAGGVVGVSALIIFLCLKLRRTRAAVGFDGSCIAVAAAALLVHYIFVSDYWFPMLWMALAALDAFGARSVSQSLRRGQVSPNLASVS